MAIASRIVDFPEALGPTARNPAGSIGSTSLRNERNSSSSRARRRIWAIAGGASVRTDDHWHDHVSVGIRLHRPDNAGLIRAVHPDHNPTGAENRKHVDQIARVERDFTFQAVDRGGDMTLAAASLCCRRRHFEVAWRQLVTRGFGAQAHHIVIVTREESRPANRGEKVIAPDFESSCELARHDLAKIGKGAVDQSGVELRLSAVHHELPAIWRNRQLDRVSTLTDD